VPLFKDAATASPENLEYVEGYLSALIAVGRMQEATEVVQRATARFPGNAMLSYLSGRVADALDNPKEAEEAYKRAIAAPDAQNPDAYLYLARQYMRFRRFAEAKPQLEAGLEKAPNNAALRVGMGELAFYERDLVRADAEFRKAIELDPASADATLGLSRVSLENGKFDLAEAQVEKALELNPRISGGKLQHGITLWKLGRLDEALAVLLEVHAEDSRNSQITVTLGAVAFEKGDLPKALEYLNSADPANPDGNFYRARGQQPAAKPHPGHRRDEAGAGLRRQEPGVSLLDGAHTERRAQERRRDRRVDDRARDSARLRRRAGGHGPGCTSNATTSSAR
jgi:tetratricopeptide (TPR) repeat protein